MDVGWTPERRTKESIYIIYAAQTMSKTIGKTMINANSVARPIILLLLWPVSFTCSPFIYYSIRNLEQQPRTMSEPGSLAPKVLVLHGYVAYLVIRRLTWLRTCYNWH